MCSSCPRGRFSTHNASTQCDICLSGHHTGGFEEGSSVCLKCDPGMSILFYPLHFISALLTAVFYNQNRHVFIHKFYSRMRIMFERTLHVKERIDILRDMSRGNATSPRHWEFEMRSGSCGSIRKRNTLSVQLVFRSGFGQVYDMSLGKVL